MFVDMLHLKDSFSFLGENDCDPVLSLYLPRNLAEMKRQAQKRPCMLICPGGGYGFVSEREAEPIALHLLPEGYNVFILQYSIQPNHFPTQLREVAAAMELIHQNADLWHCDTTRIAIMGFSAGGHLAAHYTNCYACAEVREKFPQSKPVHAAVLGYPVITTDPAHSHKGSFRNLLGHDPKTQQEQDFFSCEKQVSKMTPPTFLWHTAADTCVPVMNSLLYSQALAANGIPFALHIYPQGYHGLATADLQTNDQLPPELGCIRNWLPEMKTWLANLFQMQ